MAQETTTTTKPDQNLINPSSTIINGPILIVHSPKTPINKLKSLSLENEIKEEDINNDEEQHTKREEKHRNVFSMPNTPKHQLKQNNNLKKFPSINSIVQTTTTTTTLKTLPEIKTVQDFSLNYKTTTIRNNNNNNKKSGRGLLERRGSNANLTIDLSNLNQTKSQSNLNLTTNYECQCKNNKKLFERRKSQETTTCNNCTIHEQKTITSTIKKCTNCNVKYRRKSLSNENLYVPPTCNFCCSTTTTTTKGTRRANYPKLINREHHHQFISDEFKLHLQNIQYLQTTTKLLTINDLKQLFFTNNYLNKLHLEFWEVPLNLQEKCLISGSQLKNRYKGVLPNEHSRVHLNGQQNYIHANYIKGPDYTETAYIATQGPMAHTCEDFWEMIWSNNTTCIVMLTGLVEKGRNKCELYFPLGRKSENDKSFFRIKTTKLQDKLFTFDNNEEDEEEEIFEYEQLNEIHFGKYKIKYLCEENKNEYTIRLLELHNKDEEEETNKKRVIKHYWYSNWKDHKMTNPEELLKLTRNVLNHICQQNDNNKQLNISTNMNKKKEWKNTNKTEEKTTNRKNKKTPPITQNPICSKEEISNPNLICTKNGKDEMLLIQKPICTKNEEKISTVQKAICSKSDETMPLVQMSISSNQQSGPIVVHCSAGIGRTGCFLAILNGIQQLQTNLNVDVLAILCSLRLNRGGMVQTAEQYELIHRVLNLNNKHKKKIDQKSPGQQFSSWRKVVGFVFMATWAEFITVSMPANNSVMFGCYGNCNKLRPRSHDN